jgi:hypothetical protein
MSDQIFDFPQDNPPAKETPKTEKPTRKARPPQGKSFLGKILFFFVIVVLITTSFIYIQKTLLDLEAQAQISAVQTAAAIAPPGSKNSTPLPPTLESFPLTEISPSADLTATSLPPSTTSNPDFMHTATIAVQLTQAAN